MIRRVLQAVVVLLLVTAITYALLRLIPGNGAVAVMGPTAYRNPLAIAQFDRVYGFNHPWYYQYWLWLYHLAHGGLRYSWELNPSGGSVPGPPLVLPVLAVACPSGARRPGLLLEAEPERGLAAEQPPAEDGVPGRRLDHPGADPGDPDRRGAGGAPEQDRRPLLQRVLDGLLRDARLPPRHPADPGLRDQVPDLPARGSARRGGRGPVHELQRPGAADRVADPDHDRAVQPLHALGGAGQPLRGLRAHRQGQGRQRAAGAAAARAAQLPDPDRDAAGAAAPGRVCRGADHRVGVQLPGHGLPLLPVRAEPGLPGAARNYRRGGGGDSRGVAAGRYRVCGARPAG